MFKKTGSVGWSRDWGGRRIWGGGGVWVKAEDGGSSPPLGLYPCQLVYPQLQEGEREKKGDFFILLCELINISRIFFTTMQKKKKIKSLSFFVFPRPQKEDSKKALQCRQWSLNLSKKLHILCPSQRDNVTIFLKGAQAWDIRSLGFSWFLHHKVSTCGRLRG